MWLTTNSVEIDSFHVKEKGVTDVTIAPMASPLEALECSLACSSIVHSWAEMVDVPWPRDPLHRKEPEEPFTLKLAWKMDWSSNEQSTQISCITSNPQDKVDHDGFIIFAFDYESKSIYVHVRVKEFQVSVHLRHNNL